MASGYTVFVTYQLTDAPFTASTSYGFGTPLHCAYVQTITTDVIIGKGANLFFNSLADFSFLRGSGTTGGTGYSASRLYIVAQVVSGITDSTITITPDPANWGIIDVTDQIPNHTVGEFIEPTNLISHLFSFEPVALATEETYKLDYLNYPTNTDDTLGGYPEENFRLSFGEEVFFYGNVRSDIRATAYTTDIPINLSLNEFNASTNPTWNQASVYVTEVGLYNNNGDLVAIGKLNNPIEKNSNIARTILFAMDF